MIQSSRRNSQIDEDISESNSDSSYEIYDIHGDDHTEKNDYGTSEKKLREYEVDLDGNIFKRSNTGEYQEDLKKIDFHELDETIDLISEYKFSQNGMTKVKQNIRYAKNQNQIKVMFMANNQMVDDEDVVVVQFAKKAVNQHDFNKL